MNHDVMRFAQIAVRVWGCQMDFANPENTAKAGIEALRNFLISIGMPKNFAELGAKEEDIEKMAKTACYGDGSGFGKLYGFTVLEHYLKVKLINDCQNSIEDDGYEVVEKFLESHLKIKESLVQFSRISSYSGNSFDRYVETPSVWSLVEMVNFGDFISFYAFYYEYFNRDCEYIKHFESVRRLRNACAHNVCMLSSFKPVANFKYDFQTSFELLQGKLGIGNGVISSCMKVPLLNDFAVLLSVYTKLISSPKIKEMTLREVKEFFEGRMIYRKEYFENNSDIKNAYQFAKAVLEHYSNL